MDYGQLKDLIYFLQSTNVRKISIEQSDLKISIEMQGLAGRGGAPVQMPVMEQALVYAQPQAPVQPVQQPIMVAQQQPVVQERQPETPKSEPAAPATTQEDTSKYLQIKSPMVGTFYRSPAPDKPPFVKVGDTVTADTPVCLIEAMKLFNEVKAELSGRIVKVLVEDAGPVEYDQVLFLVEPA